MNQFAYVDDGTTVEVRPVDEAARASGRLVWIHLDHNDPATRPFLAQQLGLDHIVVNALTALETRPRCDPIDGGALINLRGLALEQEPDADDLVSIRLWTDSGRVVSVSRYMMRAMPIMCAAMKGGRVLDPGDFVAMLADAITEQLDPDVAELGDSLDDCEVKLDGTRAFVLRRAVTQVRSRAIEYRRFVAPQRQALDRLSKLTCGWLEPDDRLHLAEAADRFARMTEELESIRERAALMHEQITDLRAEVTEQRSLVVSVLALVFLPLTFLTGLFGMNVKLPYQDAAWGFNAILGLSVAVVAGGIGYFFWARWIR